MSGFVIRYNKTTSERILQEFRGPNGHRAALQERMRIEREDGLGPEWEVVSLNADSLETIESTHSRYFRGEELQTL
ncbi:MAG: hypothetical protein L0G87_10015 [Renibacterium salmoninarum]|jgi:hypothetical protein|nr:hypothetical protein [Renibacterium salmoninarum]